MNSITDFVLHEDAFALRPVRVVRRKNKDAELLLFTATTCSEDPWEGCRSFLWKCFLFGRPVMGKTNLLIDVLNKDGDIIQDFAVTDVGFAYLRRILKFEVASEDQD